MQPRLDAQAPFDANDLATMLSVVPMAMALFNAATQRHSVESWGRQRTGDARAESSGASLVSDGEGSGSADEVGSGAGAAVPDAVPTAADGHGGSNGSTKSVGSAQDAAAGDT